MQVDIITAFPGLIASAFEESIIKIARKKGLLHINIHNLRDWAEDKHRTIDDIPYGGGAGMIFKVEPLYNCLNEILSKAGHDKQEIIMTSPRGEVLTQKTVVSFAVMQHLVVICGRYKGVDQRITEFFPIREVSIGDYVLSGGEPAAVVLIDTVARLLPGVLHDIDSAWTDSFEEFLLDCDYYTKPREFKGISVPEVLISGNHEQIGLWRQANKEENTRKRRPTLYKQYIKHIK